MTSKQEIETLLEKIDDTSLGEGERIEMGHRVAEEAPLYAGYAHRLDHVQGHAEQRGESKLASELKKAAAHLRYRHGV